MDLEEKIANSEDSRFFDRLWKRKWLRRSVLPLAAATSIFFSYPKLSEATTSKQQVTLKHDPVLLIHGLKIGQDSLEEYCDFNANKVVDFDDFFLFTEKFGAKEGDSKYDPGFDIDRDGKIGLEDFFLFSINFNRTVEPLETTWDALSMSLHRDLKWTNGGAIGKWMPNRDLQPADFYTIRLSSGNKLNFLEQGNEVKYAVEKINKLTGRKAILAGFSMGGLSARAYLQNNLDPKASALVTICTPHSGSYLAYLPERSEISKWAAIIPKVGWVAQAADFFLFYLSLGKPAINYLEPCSPELELLNSEIYKMPVDINYVDVISQLPDQDLLKKLVNNGIDLINKYKQGYQKCRQVASEDLLAKGDGVVPTVSQLLRYAILNTNTKNVEWYEKAKKNMAENAEMEVFHTGGNKQTPVIKKVLEDVIKKIEEKQPETSSFNIIDYTNLDVGNAWSLSDQFTSIIDDTTTIAGKPAISRSYGWQSRSKILEGFDGNKFFRYSDNKNRFFRPPLLLWDVNVKIGSEYETKTKSIDREDGTWYDLVFKIDYSGFEHVDAPFSKFEDCLKVIESIKISSPYVSDTLVDETSTFWYSKGIGLVKYQHVKKDYIYGLIRIVSFLESFRKDNKVYPMNEEKDLSGKIIYLLDDEDSIYSINADGSQNNNVLDLRRLDSDRPKALHGKRLTVAPDGTNLAVFLEGYGIDHSIRDIFVYNLITKERIIYKNADPSTLPSFVGGFSFYVSSQKDTVFQKDGLVIGIPDLFVSDRKGNLRNITNTDYISEKHPSWSPSGDKIAYYEFENNGVYLRDANGGNRSKVTETPNGLVSPASWFPNGNRLVFGGDGGRRGSDLWIVNTDGTKKTRLTYVFKKPINPHWVP